MVAANPIYRTSKTRVRNGTKRVKRRTLDKINDKKKGGREIERSRTKDLDLLAVLETC